MDDSEILEEWKKLFDEEEIKKVVFETIQQFLRHPNKESFIDWKDDSIQNGKTLLACALWYGRLDIARLLLENGADFNCVNKFGTSAIMNASWQGNLEMVKALLDMGADIRMVNSVGSTALMFAAMQGHTEIIKFLLSKGADIRIANEKGWTAFMYASWQGRTEAVKVLFDKGADPNVADKNGSTTLMHACDKGRTETVKVLLDKGADINAANKKGQTALMWASGERHTEIVELLLAKGADITFANAKGNTALIWASMEGNTEVVGLLLGKGADIAIANNDGITALIAAAQRGHIEVTKLLLEKGADVTIANKNGDVALMFASQGGHVEVVKLLLEKGADLNIAGKYGETALLAAAQGGHNDIVKLLLDKGADITNINKRGFTALSLASRQGETSTAKLLLEMGADMAVANIYGMTALALASNNGYTDIVELLLDEGAEKNTINNRGDTPLNIASQGGHDEIVKRLLEKGVDSNIANNNGDTALILALKERHDEIVKLLLEKGVDVNIANKNGNTALMNASGQGNAEMMQLLLDRGADMNFANKNGWTALMGASRNGLTKAVKLLLDKGADLTIVDNDGNTALIVALREGHTEIVQLLLENGADHNIVNKTGDTALNISSQGGHNEIVKLLLEKGADINVANKEGDTALNIASCFGQTETLKLLMENGADTNVPNKNGDTALSLAVAKGHVEIVGLLLDKGVDTNAANKNGDTSLSLALKKGHSKIVELLADKGADPDVCNSSGQTLLHWACLQDLKVHAEQVLEIGTDKDKIDVNGHTALFYAAEKGLVDIVELLMAQNAASNKTDERKLETEYRYDSDDCSDSDYDPDEKIYYYTVKDGRTPLFIAAQNGHHDVVALLLQHGADPYLCNNESQIPRDVSVVHSSIQQLFHIHDFFDQREQGRAYKEAYITCRNKYWLLSPEEKKKPVSPLEDIIHDIVKYPHFANKFLELYQENRGIVNWLDKDGRTVQQVACKECREVVMFLRQYDLEDKPVYESPTCKIYNALDYGGPDEPNMKQPRRVALKFFAKKKHFENEMDARRTDDGSPRFSSEFVIPHVAAYRADQNSEYAEACRTWKSNGAKTELGLDYSYCVVMERGERNLMEAMNNENLSAANKDLERRDMLQKLCKIFSYLHGMGYVHGDIKPHNVVRHTGTDPTVTWKAIDFDACTKIGDVVGLKLTTGSAPPEMLKIIQNQDASDIKSMGESKAILRQPEGDLEESDLVLAKPSFDVWSYGILMYHLVTGRSFFHGDLQGNVDDAGLRELANLTEGRIHEKLASVQDVNARVLLSKILRLDPEERPTMSEVGKDYYFHPSDSPQGRKAEFFGKQVFSIFVSQGRDSEKKENPLSETSQIKGEEKDDGRNNTEYVENLLASKAEFSYLKLRDEDKDWSDKLLNSEVETFRFDKLGGMGEKPKCIDGDTIYHNNFLRGLLSRKGPDYFMGFLVEYFELYKIMNDAHEVCQGIKVNLVSDVKSLKGIFTKLFVRGKGLNDVVRGTLFCNSIDQFNYVGRQLKERYEHNVYIKPPKDEAGAWPIPKLLIYGNRRLSGRCMSVEIQFSTVYMHLATHASNNHLVYEAIRESTGYLVNKDNEFQEFLQSLNQQYIDTEGFLRNQSAQDGRFEILLNEEGGNNRKMSDEPQESSQNNHYIAKSTGFILSGLIRCGDQIFRFMSPKDHMEQFSESSFVVNKSLTLLSSHSYWSDEPYDLEGKSIEFVVSFKGRGLAIAGIGTTQCMHGTTESDGGGDRCSVHVGRSKFVVRKSGLEEVFREKKLPNQARAKIIFRLKDGSLSVSFVGSNRKDEEEEVESIKVSMLPDQEYYLYMRAPPGVHDVKFHDINILEDEYSLRSADENFESETRIY